MTPFARLAIGCALALAAGQTAAQDVGPGIALDSRPALATTEDRDRDRVADADDVCPASAIGFPVRNNGCALLDGVLSGVRFADGGSDMLPGSTEQLDSLASLLKEYPKARVELHSHTDDSGTPRDQAILTRARLRTVGTHLVAQGVSANRLVLRSFGGARPIADNSTPAGRAENNRIEVLEHTN